MMTVYLLICTIQGNRCDLVRRMSFLDECQAAAKAPISASHGRWAADTSSKLDGKPASLHCMQVNVQALYLQELDRPIPAIVR